VKRTKSSQKCYNMLLF